MRAYLIVWKRSMKHRDMRVAVYFLVLLVALSIFADFLAGEYPILWKDHDGLEMPVARNYIGKIRYGSKYYLPNEYRDGQADWAIWPAIRYGPSNIDREVGGYVRPLSPGHFLGTDPIGRDVAAGIVHGCRISLTVGVLAVFMAFLVGSFTGMLTAYYGDDKLTMPTPEILVTILSAPFIGFYTAKVAALMDPPFSVFAFVLVFIFAYFLLFKLFRRIRKQVPARKMVRIPLDILFMRFMEVFRSLPGLFIILTLLVWVRSPGLWILAGVIALFYWTTFARYIRGELLRLRDLPFVKRFLLEGKSDLSILYGHLFPNALTPLMVVGAFAMGSAVILESTLSFLGLGLPPDYVSWGSIMSDARLNVNAWWLALFPGLAILATVLAFNAIGRRLNEEMGEKVEYLDH